MKDVLRKIRRARLMAEAQLHKQAAALLREAAADLERLNK